MTTEEMLVSLVENVKNINSTLNNMNKQFDDINNQIAEMKTDIQNVKDETKQISEMKTDIQKMKNEIREISLTLENETNRNIKIIAEGHLDLSRKLDKALTVENEKEMALIRINMMENELRRIKTMYYLLRNTSFFIIRLFYNKTLTCHLFRFFKSHKVKHSRAKVTKSAVLNFNIACTYKNHRNRVSCMSCKRSFCNRVD